MPSTDSDANVDAVELQRQWRMRVTLFVGFAFVFAILLSLAYVAIESSNRLERVERERDQWQQSWVIVQQLAIKEGNDVADVGSGVGYFALKLSDTVGRSGRVMAEDIEAFPLHVLQTRAFFSGRHNIKTVLGDVDNPKLPNNTIDAALISNTYHELTSPDVILNHLLQSLKPGGRLVIVDHGPQSESTEACGTETKDHEVAPSLVETDLRKAGFELILRNDHFTEQPGESNPWFLIVARRPALNR
jgi:ubiquinone/menaquinone biosynthesis C-methylase UbiE